MRGGLSVVIPTFERKALTRRAVDSALCQTLPPNEIIVVDDASTDGTDDYIRSAYANECRVRVIRTPFNAGACAARNLGITEAKYDWVAFLDSDDRWHPEKLASQASALENTSEAVACFTGLRAVRNAQVIYEMLPPTRPTLADLLHRNVLGSTSCALFSRDALAACGGFDLTLRSCQDWDLYMRVLLQGSAVGVPTVLLDYDEGNHRRISNAIDQVKSGHATVHARARGHVASPIARFDLRMRHAMSLAEVISARGGSATEALILGTLALGLGRDPARYAGFARVIDNLVWRTRAVLGPVVRRRFGRTTIRRTYSSR